MKFSQRQANSPTWSKADLHLHTTYSDGFLSPQKTVALIARRTELSVIAITDHDTAAGAFVARDYAQLHQPQLDVIIGQEVTTGDGDVLGLFLNSTIAYCSTAAAAIEAIHAQGGLAVAAHPFVRHFGLASVGNLIRTLPFDAVEVRHGVPFSLLQNWQAGRINAAAQRLPALGSSDSHIPYTAGEAFTWFPGHSAADLRRAHRRERGAAGRLALVAGEHGA